MSAKEIKNIELDLFLEAIFRRYGYDFRNYARASLRRRVAKTLNQAGIDSAAEAIPKRKARFLSKRKICGPCMMQL